MLLICNVSVGDSSFLQVDSYSLSSCSNVLYIRVDTEGFSGGQKAVVWKLFHSLFLGLLPVCQKEGDLAYPVGVAGSKTTYSCWLVDMLLLVHYNNWIRFTVTYSI